MRKLIIFIVFMITCSMLFGQAYFEEINDNGEHKFSTTISTLKKNDCSEEVRIQNNSSFKLNNISCLIEIGNVKHNLKNINYVKIGEEEEFDGYEDDELDDELEHYFGKVAKWQIKNTNNITFTLNFSDHNSDVVIRKIYNRDESLVFEIGDSDNAITTEQQLKKTGAEILEVDGKKYILYNGQAIEVKN